MHFPEKLYGKATDALPPSLAASIDLCRPSLLASWGGPMNGQRERQRIVRALARAIDFRFVIETGTYRGTTTEFLANIFGCPLVTVESHKRSYSYSLRRLRGHDDVTVVWGDSRTLLKTQVDCPEPGFVYLDAHWESDLPLRKELMIIRKNWTAAVVMIDDFEVPGDAGYAFDDYGPEKRLSAAYLPPLEGWTLFYPSAPSEKETGAKRGCCLLTTDNLASVLRDLDCLGEG